MISVSQHFLHFLQLLGTQASNLFDYIDKSYTGLVRISFHVILIRMFCILAMLCQNALFCVKIDFAAFKAALFPNTVSDNYLHPHFVQILFCATHFQFVMSRCNSILFRATLFCCSFDLPHKIVLLRKPNQNFFCCCLCTHSTRLVDVFTLILFRFIQTFCLVQFY